LCVFLFFSYYKQNYTESQIQNDMQNNFQRVLLYEDEVISNLILNQSDALEFLLKDISVATNANAIFSKTINSNQFILNKTNERIYHYLTDDARYQIAVPITGLSNETYGYLILKGAINPHNIHSITNAYYVFLGINIFFMIALASLVFIAFKKYLHRPMQNIIHEAALAYKSKETLDNINTEDIAISEIANIKKELYLIIGKLNKNAALAAIGESSSMVAHDIRSPLAALEAAAGALKKLPEDQRLMILSAVQRINDIANDLADKKHASQSKLHEVNENLSKHLISSLIDSIVSEKRMQYHDQHDVHIEFVRSNSPHGLFVSVQANHFKRALSNIINNAVEAIKGFGSVKIKLELINNEVVLNISDTGIGMPASVLAKVTQQHFTHGKKKGSGLGLYHAKKCFESWKGKLSIDSKPKLGTTVSITLPLQSAPSWFVPQINIAKNAQIIVLDDDHSIHQVWKSRLAAYDLLNNITHFKSATEILSWFQNHNMNSNLLFLCDYELLNSHQNGLDIIEKLGLTNNAILVTSQYDSSKVRMRCESLGIKLLPKNLAGAIPIIIEDPLSVNTTQNQQEQPIILIDDDELVRSTWTTVAKVKGKKLITFASPSEFNLHRKNINKETTIYIDSNFPNGEKGEVFSKELFSDGFDHIYITTGTDKDDFPAMPWIQAIIDKRPPFLYKH
jgi:signal transduction histidine kinase/FixJ family two-component response regulator